MHTIQHQGQENMRIALSIMSIILLSAFTGSSVAMRFPGWVLPKEKVNTSLFLAASIPDRQNPSQETINALNSVQITQLTAKQVEDETDRKLLHDQIYTLAQTELTHHNTLMNRLDVDEARLNWTGTLVGGGVTILNGFMLFFQISEWLRRRRERNEGKPAL